MATEIERAFLAAAVPAEIATSTGVRLQQGYLAEEGTTSVRLRIADDAATLTIKSGTGLARTEVEVPLAVADADALWPSTAGRRVDKMRYRVPVDAHTAEVDVFAGELDGLCRIEVEFDSTRAADGFEPPGWFGREVTGDPAWSNASLARNGRPDR